MATQNEIVWKALEEEEYNRIKAQAGKMGLSTLEGLILLNATGSFVGAYISAGGVLVYKEAFARAKSKAPFALPPFLKLKKQAREEQWAWVERQKAIVTKVLEEAEAARMGHNAAIEKEDVSLEKTLLSVEAIKPTTTTTCGATAEDSTSCKPSTPPRTVTTKPLSILPTTIISTAAKQGKTPPPPTTTTTNIISSSTNSSNHTGAAVSMPEAMGQETLNLGAGVEVGAVDEPVYMNNVIIKAIERMEQDEEKEKDMKAVATTATVQNHQEQQQQQQKKESAEDKIKTKEQTKQGMVAEEDNQLFQCLLHTYMVVEVSERGAGGVGEGREGEKLVAFATVPLTDEESLLGLLGGSSTPLLLLTKDGRAEISAGWVWVESDGGGQGQERVSLFPAAENLVNRASLFDRYTDRWVMLSEQIGCQAETDGETGGKSSRTIVVSTLWASMWNLRSISNLTPP